jgi:hypothetical protein
LVIITHVSIKVIHHLEWVNFKLPQDINVVSLS